MEIVMILFYITIVSIAVYMAGYDRGKRRAYKDMCPFNKEKGESHGQ